MEKYRLGKTGLNVTKISFGALPIQRQSLAESVRIFHRAYDAGINFYDTARVYTDSEEKMGAAFKDIRKNIIIASKVSGAQNGREVTALIEESLRDLQTDYIDLMQFHNTPFAPAPGSEDGMYDAMSAAKQQGKIRHIGLTNHSLRCATEAIASGLYETIQFPLCHISTPEELQVIDLCNDADIGVLAMKPLAGGLLNNAAAVYHFFEKYAGKCIPLYGIQAMSELEEFLGFLDDPPDAEAAEKVIYKDRLELQDDFCRGCGYCLPCAAGIDLPMAARMYHMIRRSSMKTFFNDYWYAEMQKINECMECGACNPRCPYHLDPQHRLKEQYKDYMECYARYKEKQPEA